MFTIIKCDVKLKGKTVTTRYFRDYEAAFKSLDARYGSALVWDDHDGECAPSWEYGEFSGNLITLRVEE